MAETLRTKKDESYYTELVSNYFKDPKYAKTTEEQKNKFMQLCVVNKLNPILGQAYAVPYGTNLQMTVSYKMFQERAEESGLLSGWNILRTRDKDRKIISGKITIYRKDWNHPFEEEVELADVMVATNPLWKSNPYGMLKKQLIRMGFANCFPANIKAVDVDPEVIIDAEPVVDEPTAEIEGPQGESGTQGDVGVRMIDSDQEDFINNLIPFLPNFPLPDAPKTFNDAEKVIKTFQSEIARRYIKTKTLKLTISQIENIFVGSDEDIQTMRKAAIEQFHSNIK